MPGQDFLATIKLVLDKAGVTQGLAEVKKQVGSVPWDSKSATDYEKNVKKVFGAVADVTDETGKASAKMGDFEKALRRAMIVAPIWMLARETIKQLINFVKDGITYYLETEKAMHNVQSALQAMGAAGETVVSELASRFHNLSIETGKSEASIANVFAEQVRVLGDTKKAWESTSAAQKLAIATGGDAAKIAETMSFLYAAQGKTLREAATDVQKFHDLQVMLYEAQSRVPGGIEKLSSELLAGIPIMKETNISIEDFIKLNVAMNQAGITTAQTLKTGLMKVLTNLPEITKQLNLPVNTAPLTVFLTVLERISSASKAGNLAAVGTMIKDIFGGIRGGQIAAMANDIDKIRALMAEPLINPRSEYLFRKQIQDTNVEAGHQIEIFQILKRDAGEAFVTGIAQGKDFAEALKNINKVAAASPGFFKILGNSIKEAFTYATLPIPYISTILEKLLGTQEKAQELHQKTADLNERIKLGLTGNLRLEETRALIEELQTHSVIKQTELGHRLIAALERQVSLEKAKSEEQDKINAKKETEAYLEKKQADELENLIFKYAQVGPGERTRVRREIELLQLPEESQIAAFQNLPSDRKLMLEMQSKLTANVREAMARIIASEAGLNIGGRFGMGGVSTLEAGFPPGYKGGILAPGQRLISITPKGADTINVNVDARGKAMEETIQEIENKVKDTLLKDEDFQKAFGQKISGKV